ncbi:unnamed protein product, partial [Rotaria magnacalcarata]
MTFILFINGRLVDCQPLIKSIQQMYAVLVNKQTSPFVYLDLIMDPTTLDVNIHPSKNEVRFLHADPIIVSIVQAIEHIIVAKSAKQTTTTTQLTFHMTPTSIALVPPTPKDPVETDTSLKKTSSDTTNSTIKKGKFNDECHTDLLNIIRNFVYVGTIDGQSSLIQHDTQLYLVHTRHLFQELFYQLCIYHFGNMGTIRLEPEPPSIE